MWEQFARDYEGMRRLNVTLEAAQNLKPGEQLHISDENSELIVQLEGLDDDIQEDVLHTLAEIAREKGERDG